MDGKALYSAASDNYRKALFIQAIEAYESLFKLQNSNLEEHELIKAHFECGAAHHSLNQLEEASHHYGIIIDHSLADLKIKAEALLNRAAIFTEQRNYAEALKDTEEAVKTGEAVWLDSDLLEIWREQISNLKVATPQPSVKNQATSSMITDQ